MCLVLDPYSIYLNVYNMYKHPKYVQVTQLKNMKSQIVLVANILGSFDKEFNMLVQSSKPVMWMFPF